MAGRRRAFPTGVSQILEKLLTARKLKKKIDDCRIFAYWDEAVGERIAARTEPQSLRQGVLKVAVADHAWLQQLQFLKEEIRERLNEAAGEAVVSSIYFHHGVVHPKPPPPPDIATELQKIRLSDEEKARIDKVADGIADREIRERIIRAMVKEAKRKKLADRDG